MIRTKDTLSLRIRQFFTTSGKRSPNPFLRTAVQPWGARAIIRNEDVYPNPDVFNPDRFMNPSKPEILQHMDSVWGFGRRGCPGRALAEANLWSVIANTIAVMDIRKVLDEDGNPVTPAAEFKLGAVRCVKEQCDLTRALCRLTSDPPLDTRNHSNVQLPTVPSERDSLSQMQWQL